MPTIYFIRHGQTDWNAEHRPQGQRDIPLNDTGRAQAQHNGENLRDLLPDPERLTYVSSPLCRAVETMQIVRRAIGLDDDDFSRDARLREIGFGTWEGRTWDELHAAEPDAIAQYLDDPWNFIQPGGEGYAQTAARAVAWLNSVTDETVVVAHGGVCRCLQTHIAGWPPSEVLDRKVPQDRIMIIQDGEIGWC